MLFDTFVDTVWRPSCVKLRECTKVGYESALACHILPRWSGKDLDSITVADIESWLDSFDKAGAARKAWAVFRSILRLAYRRGMTDNDVTRREIRLPHLRHYDPQVLTAPEVRRLLKGFYGHPLEAWLLVSVCAGLRRCESVGIEWTELDLRRGTVTVKRSVQWVAGHETVTEPKTDLSRRTVALPIKAGTDISVVARQLGHSDIQTTARYYLKPDLSVLRDMQKAWQRLILTC